MQSKWVLLILLAGLLAGCQQRAGMDSDSGQAEQLTRADGWQVTAMKDMAVLPQEVEAWFEFDAENQRLQGNTGCNRMSAGYQLGDDGVLSLSALAATKRACEPPRMSIEQALVENLQTVTSWSISDGHLMLRDADGVVRVVAHAR